MKHIVKVILLVILCGIVFMGCSKRDNSKSSESTENVVEVEFWTMALSPAFDDYINGMIESFEQENPTISIKWVDVPWDQMETKILTSISGGTAPQVVNLNPQFASKLAIQGALVNPESYMTQQDIDSYFAGIYQSSSFQGEIFALPWYITNSIVIYNKDLYAKAEQSALMDYSQIYDISKRVKESTGKYGYYPTFDGTHFLETLAIEGIPLVRDGKAAFNTPEMRDLVTMYVRLYQENLIPKSVLTGGHQEARNMFMAGELATLMAGPTMLGPIATDAPQIYDVTGVSAAPTGEIGYSNVAIMNLAVPVQRDKQKQSYAEAVKFALFVTNNENQVKFAKVAGTILCSTKESLQESMFFSSDGSPKSEAVVIASSQLENSKALIPPIEGLTDLKEALNNQVQRAMLGEISVEQALNEAESQWNDVLGSIDTPIDF